MYCLSLAGILISKSYVPYLPGCALLIGAMNMTSWVPLYSAAGASVLSHKIPVENTLVLVVLTSGTLITVLPNIVRFVLFRGMPWSVQVTLIESVRLPIKRPES